MYDEVITLRELKHVEPRLFLDYSMAIVGSSSILLNDKKGGEIDSFNDVIRFNRAPIEGYEDHVGTKETLRVTNNHVFDNIDASKDGFTNQSKDFIRNMRDSRILYISPVGSPWENREQNTHPSCKLYKFNYNKINELYKPALERFLCVGTIFVLLCVVSGLKPTLYGFGIDEEERTHYWEDRPGAGDCHKISVDTQILLDLEKENKIVIIR